MIIPIDMIGEGRFKITNLNEIEDSNAKLKQMLENPDKFVLAFRSCDFSYHEVNSEVSNIIKKNIDLIKKRISLPSIASEIVNDKELKIKRYLIWKSDKEAFLVGEVLQALKELSE